MSKLELYVRPLVLFDAGNKKHRHYYFDFLKTGSWKNCPVRFALHEDVGNIQGTIQRKMIEYYSEKEFGKIAA